MGGEKTPRRILGLALARLASAILVLGLIIFVPAGSLAFWNGWLYLGVIILAMSGAMIFLYRKDPSLLEKRLKTSERERPQRIFVVLSVLLFLVAFTLPGLGFRLGWPGLPTWLAILGAVLVSGGYLMYLAVTAQNSYASRVIEIQEGQRLIDTGLYGVVRHPMYLAAALMYLATPIALGSWIALMPMLLFPFLLAYRIVNEERLLVAGLPGYEDYRKRVRYRLIPFIW